MAQFQDQKRGRFNLLYDVVQFIYIIFSRNILNKFRHETFVCFGLWLTAASEKFYTFFRGIHPNPNEVFKA